MTTPHLSIHHVNVYVRDQDAAIRFLTEKLGFSVLFDSVTKARHRFVAIAAPDRGSLLSLVAPAPDTPEHALVGRSGHVVLATDDIGAKYAEWTRNGVVFDAPPLATEWAGMYTTFNDPDGNRFVLMSQDGLTRALAAQRAEVVEREETERRAAREMDIARQVQARLFPQVPPPTPGIELAGRCLQAREVGGDYYDFLPLGRQRLGLVLGDISGKGIGAALLMANLQASIRSQSSVALDEPERFLLSVNRHFFENTTAGAYASLFFGDYSQETGRLRYVNCGHPPGLLVRASGDVQELAATTSVVGLFEDWECVTRETQFEAGDSLVLYTDGVSECWNAAGEDFGLARLATLCRRNRGQSAAAQLEAILAALKEFGPGEQRDDVTLIVAKRTGPATPFVADPAGTN